MAESDQGEKTEEATQQRREDFRKRGQVAQTRELSAVLYMFASVLLIWVMSRFFFQQIHDIFQQTMGMNMAAAVRGGDYVHIVKVAFYKLSIIVLPIAGLFWLIGAVSSIVQIGFLSNEEAMQLRWERLDPVQGLKRIFSLKAIMEGLKAILKVVVILAIAYLLIWDHLQTLPMIITYSTGQIFQFVGEITIRLLAGVGFFMLTLAGLDYLYLRWDMEREMRMTKQEVKEEIKSREGDPMVRARIKRIQRDVATRRMMEDVPKANVIVTNPTHIAVALQYDETLVAPKVIAKGAEAVAEKIKALAREYNIPIVENKPLARTMFKTLKIGQIIPRELYTAVAEVLSYVYRLRKKGRR